MLNHQLNELEALPPMIAVVGSTLLQKLQEWPDAPPELAHLAATCVVLADTIAWRCEEVRESLRNQAGPGAAIPETPIDPRLLRSAAIMH